MRVRVRLRVHVSVCLSVCVCVSSQLNSTQLNSTQLNQRSPAQILDFAHIFSEERQTCIVINAKILKFMDEYLLSNPLFLLGGGGKNGNIHLRFRAKLQGGKNGFRKMAAL